MNKKTYTVLALAVVAASVLNILWAEVHMHRTISRVRIGMTEQQVIDACGNPSSEGRWSGSFGKGKFFTYATPYWWNHCWDFMAWSVWWCSRDIEKLPSFAGDNSRRCSITFRIEGETSTVFEVTTTAAYSKSSFVVRRDPGSNTIRE